MDGNERLPQKHSILCMPTDVYFVRGKHEPHVLVLERLSMTFTANGKRQTAKIELLVSDFSCLYSLGKLFAFTVIKGFFPYFSTGFI